MKETSVVREPSFDWSVGLVGPRLSCPAFSYGFVASSLVIAAFEPFIVRVTKRMLDQGLVADERVRADAVRLIGQESSHGSQHRRLNQELGNLGYGGVADQTRKIVADFAGYLRNKDLRYCAAYCAAFELFGLVFCDFFFHHPFMRKARSPGHGLLTDVWTWHFAEEYEHRSVAIDLYQESFRINAARAYLFRLRVTSRVVHDLFSWSSRLVAAMKAFDRANLGPEACSALVTQQERYEAQWGRFFLTKTWTVLSPTYKPGEVVWPEVDRYLESLPTSWSAESA